jgi:hypothetical protein
MLLFALPALAAPTPAVPQLDAATEARLLGGEVVIVADAAGTLVSGDGTAILAAPLDRVRAVIADFPGQADWIPDMDEAVLVGTDGDAALCSAVTRIPWPISDRTWTIRVTSGPAELGGEPVWVSTWTYVPGSGNMVENAGYWLLVPRPDGRTLVRYAFAADAGLHVPDFIERMTTRSMLPGILENLRTRVGP